MPGGIPISPGCAGIVGSDGKDICIAVLIAGGFKPHINTISRCTCTQGADKFRNRLRGVNTCGILCPNGLYTSAVQALYGSGVVSERELRRWEELVDALAPWEIVVNSGCYAPAEPTKIPLLMTQRHPF